MLFPSQGLLGCAEKLFPGDPHFAHCLMLWTVRKKIDEEEGGT